MRQDRLTTLAQQVVSEAQSDAAARSNPEVTGLHVLAALLSDKSGPGWSVLGKLGADASRIATITDGELSRLPKVNSGAGTPGRALMEILNRADGEARRLGDQYISSEHLLLALTEVSGPAKEVLSVNAVDKKHVERAIKEIRAASGVQNVDSPGGEQNLEALKKYAIDLTEKAAQGKLDPVIGRDEEIRRCMEVPSRGKEKHPVGAEQLCHVVGEQQVSIVNRIERATENGRARHAQRRLDAIGSRT